MRGDHGGDRIAGECTCDNQLDRGRHGHGRKSQLICVSHTSTRPDSVAIKSELQDSCRKGSCRVHGSATQKWNLKGTSRRVKNNCNKGILHITRGATTTRWKCLHYTRTRRPGRSDEEVESESRAMSVGRQFCISIMNTSINRCASLQTGYKKEAWLARRAYNNAEQGRRRVSTLF